MSSNPEVIIVGGGISGLSAAYYLRKLGVRSLVIEARPYLGGVLRTEQIAGCTVETGADSWLATKHSAADLARDAGMGKELIGSNDHFRRTWLWKKGRLHPLPEGIQLVAPSQFGPVWKSRLFGTTTKIHMTADWLRMPRAPLPERSVAEFVRNHFGQEVVDYLAEPLLTGIYGGDPAALSAWSVLPKLVEREQQHGSLVRGLEAPKRKGSIFETVKGGLSSLVEAIHPAEVCHERVEWIQHDETGFQIKAGASEIRTSQLILACESHAAARLLSPMDSQLAGLLRGIRHSSGHITAMGFRRAELRHALDGFGLLVPKCEEMNLMAATWVSTKFAHRAPADLQVIRAFFREKTQDPVRELRQIMHFGAEPIFLKNYHWPDSLPQYAVGHATRVKEIQEKVSRIPGLHLIGNAYEGVGIPDCVGLAKEAATAVHSLHSTATNT